MPVDVVDLRSFYSSPLGGVARQLLARALSRAWPSAAHLRVLGLGYATPYLPLFADGTERLAAYMPATQGVVNWPSSGLSASALVDPTMLPLADASYDRVLLVHALEHSEAPAEVLSEVWRILTPGGRLLAVVPNRRGPWARMDSTPFGHGQPYSRSQLKALMRQTLFSPELWLDALYVPPSDARLLLRSAWAWEQAGTRLALPFAGVHVVEATKQLYRPITVRAAKPALRLQPALLPSAGATMSPGRSVRAGLGRDADPWSRPRPQR
ncbi:class I SAM-dependent methyltransferase [Chelatococcus reniformis]|uniref:Methyltransferase type 11 n=1 Tax=Chelatococcus reniformis TaxID=1494448 RepID=A0A916TZ91_9HYPH|nr:class I SAM-dependent methyltransferase [Chelatococcus reniformis]GGC46392.1 methyltransferase type 11 [Chelatococcus reniformis]